MLRRIAGTPRVWHWVPVPDFSRPARQRARVGASMCLWPTSNGGDGPANVQRSTCSLNQGWCPRGHGDCLRQTVLLHWVQALGLNCPRLASTHQIGGERASSARAPAEVPYSSGSRFGISWSSRGPPRPKRRSMLETGPWNLRLMITFAEVLRMTRSGMEPRNCWVK